MQLHAKLRLHVLPLNSILSEQNNQTKFDDTLFMYAMKL